MHSGTLGSSCLSACLSQLCGAWAGGEAGRGKEVTAMSRREMAKPEDPGAGGLTFWPPGLRCRVRGSRGRGEVIGEARQYRVEEALVCIIIQTDNNLFAERPICLFRGRGH